MPNNKLEIKILTDVNKQDAHLGAMTLDVANAFLVLVESLTKIVAQTPDNKNLTIRVEEGSVTCAIDGDRTENIYTELNDIVKNNSTNTKLVKPWRDVQNLFLSNGLQYQAIFYSKEGVSTPVLDIIKNDRKTIRVKTVRKPAINTQIEFIVSKLIAVGGKSPNIHIETGDGERLIIDCTQEQATKAKTFLYDEILLCVWIEGKGTSKGYRLCDSFYPNQRPYFEELKESIEYIRQAPNEVDSLKRVHYVCKKFLLDKRYGVLRKFMRLFDYEGADLGAIKTILIITTPFRKHERLKETIESLENIFSKKINRLNKKRINGQKYSR